VGVIRPVRIDTRKLNNVITDSRLLDRLLRDRAETANRFARAAFVAKQVSTNEGRLSATTPPKYMLSFRTERVKRARSLSWIAKNTDPAAAWVEYGAHAGGRTFVLRYRPYGTALRIMGARY
jgi:hypothetical protein